MMNDNDKAAMLRRNTIAELVESMRAAQREARLNNHELDGSCLFMWKENRVGIWKGGTP